MRIYIIYLINHIWSINSSKPAAGRHVGLPEGHVAYAVVVQRGHHGPNSQAEAARVHMLDEHLAAAKSTRKRLKAMGKRRDSGAARSRCTRS